MYSMKIAIPTTNGLLSMHFGHCEQFTFYDIDADNKTILQTGILDAPPHQPGLLPAWLHEQGVDCVIAGGIGMKAQQLFQQAGVDVIPGAPPIAPEEIVQQYLQNTLQCGTNACDH
jgi:predicted Fe-Mo cluster-binding NifX family protein